MIDVQWGVGQWTNKFKKRFLNKGVTACVRAEFRVPSVSGGWRRLEQDAGDPDW